VFVEQFSSEIPRYLERLRVKSGVTGWAQVNGLRGNTSVEDRLDYDLYYIENWSLWFDIKIILRTFLAIFKGDGAY
jgi:lipopolysaccharide/colanic/teichoic acid biosynthesis glycosyltransferase